MKSLLLNESLREDFRVRTATEEAGICCMTEKGVFVLGWLCFLHFEKEKWEDANSSHGQHPEGSVLEEGGWLQKCLWGQNCLLELTIVLPLIITPLPVPALRVTWVATLC